MLGQQDRQGALVLGEPGEVRTIPGTQPRNRARPEVVQVRRGQRVLRSEPSFGLDVEGVVRDQSGVAPGRGHEVGDHPPLTRAGGGDLGLSAEHGGGVLGRQVLQRDVLPVDVPEQPQVITAQGSRVELLRGRDNGEASGGRRVEGQNIGDAAGGVDHDRGPAPPLRRVVELSQTQARSVRDVLLRDPHEPQEVPDSHPRILAGQVNVEVTAGEAPAVPLEAVVEELQAESSRTSALARGVHREQGRDTRALVDDAPSLDLRVVLVHVGRRGQGAEGVFGTLGAGAAGVVDRDVVPHDRGSEHVTGGVARAVSRPLMTQRIHLTGAVLLGARAAYPDGSRGRRAAPEGDRYRPPGEGPGVRSARRPATCRGRTRPRRRA